MKKTVIFLIAVFWGWQVGEKSLARNIMHITVHSATYDANSLSVVYGNSLIIILVQPVHDGVIYY